MNLAKCFKHSFYLWRVYWCKMKQTSIFKHSEEFTLAAVLLFREMSWCLRKPSLCCVLVFVCLTAMAQQESPSLTRFTTEQGLADDWVHTAMQDSKGFLWFGTEGGLSRFDGQRFFNFYEEKNNPNSLSSNKVRGLCEDPDGTFWLASLDGGLDHFDPSSGRSISWPTDSAQAWQDSDKPLSFICIHQDGDLLWLGSYDHGLGCFDKSHV